MFDLDNCDLKTYEKNFLPPMYANYISVFGDIFEFGIYGGGSLKSLIDELNREQIKYNNIFAFDSFCGLPSNNDNNGRIFNKGSFNVQRLLNTSDVKKIKDYLLKKTHYIPKIIDGIFENTLTKELIVEHNIQPASYISIDCDLYSSTCTVLEWIFSNNLFQKGTIIRYDDWFSDTFSGEERAHKEKCKKYNINVNLVYNNHEMRLVRII